MYLHILKLERNIIINSNSDLIYVVIGLNNVIGMINVIKLYRYRTKRKIINLIFFFFAIYRSVRIFVKGCAINPNKYSTSWLSRHKTK